MEKIRNIILAKLSHKKNELFMKSFLETQNAMYFIQKYYGF